MENSLRSSLQYWKIGMEIVNKATLMLVTWMRIKTASNWVRNYGSKSWDHFKLALLRIDFRPIYPQLIFRRFFASHSYFFFAFRKHGPKSLHTPFSLFFLIFVSPTIWFWFQFALEFPKRLGINNGWFQLCWVRFLK